MGEDLKTRVENDFSYHRPPEEKVEDLKRIRSGCREMAHLLVNHVPKGRELSTALTKLEEVMMHANAGIARQFPVDE